MAMNQDQIWSTSFLSAASSTSFCRPFWMFWKRSTIFTSDSRQLHSGWFSKVVARMRARIASFSYRIAKAFPVCPIAASSSPHSA